jgi:hypothetical protein
LLFVAAMNIRKRRLSDATRPGSHAVRVAKINSIDHVQAFRPEAIDVSQGTITIRRAHARLRRGLGSEQAVCSRMSRYGTHRCIFTR